MVSLRDKIVLFDDDFLFCDLRIVNGYIYMKGVPVHRIITAAPKGKYVDHINGNKCDNRKSNLRIVSNSENCLNRHCLKTSKYPHVSLHRQSGKYVSQKMINGKIITFGYFKTESEAFDAIL
jgi:hypothetical protein